MEEGQGIEEAEEDDVEADESGGVISAPIKLAIAKHLAEVNSETAFLSGLLSAELRTALLEVVAGSRKVLPESLVRLSVAAHKAGDRSVLSLTFGALTKTATPLLASQASQT